MFQDPKLLFISTMHTGNSFSLQSPMYDSSQHFFALLVVDIVVKMLSPSTVNDIELRRQFLSYCTIRRFDAFWEASPQRDFQSFNDAFSLSACV